MTSTIAAPEIIGRHSWGTPGLIHVSTFARVRTRGFFGRLFHRGRHRRPEQAEAPALTPAPRPAI